MPKKLPLIFTIELAVICLAALLLSAPSFAASPIEAGFSTDGSSLDLVLQTINGAHKQLRIAAYSFTSKPIAQALLNAKRRGVDVSVVVDKSQETERYTSATFLANAGIPVRVDHMHAIHHNKFIVSDQITVETGSFNYTDSAARRNAENVIVILGNPVLASSYLAEWQTHWQHSIPMSGRY